MHVSQNVNANAMGCLSPGKSACRVAAEVTCCLMPLYGILVGFVILFILQYIANRLLVLSPERLSKAAIQVKECNSVYAHRLVSLNRESANSWAETVDYDHILADWKKAIIKVLHRFDYLHHSKENNDFRLPLLLIASPLTAESVKVPDKFIFRVAAYVLQEILKASGEKESELLARMAEQLEPNSPMAARLWEFRIFLLGSGRSSAMAQQATPGHSKFALLSAIHMSFGTNSRSRLLRSRWNTPRVLLETLAYGGFQLAIYFFLFSPAMGHRQYTILAAGQKIEFEFLGMAVAAVVLVGLATLWFLMRFRRYVHARKFHALVDTLLKAGVISDDELRAYGGLVLNLRPDDGFPWLRRT